MSNNSKAIDLVDPKLITKILMNLIKTNSENPPGSTKDIVNYLHAISQELEFSSNIIPVGPGERENHITSIGNGPRKLVLCGHLDTVPAGDISLWDVPPFAGQIKDGFIFGRGAADMKGGVAAMLGAMAALHKSGIHLPRQIVFAGTADEESTMLGAQSLLKTGVIQNTDFLVIGEPTSNHVGLAEKGVLWLKLEIRGRAAHGSMPELGVNAIEGACIAIEVLNKLIPMEKDELLGKSTLNVGRIIGGTKINVVPEKCIMECDIRVIPGIDINQLMNSIIDALKALESNSPYTYVPSFTSSLPSLSAPRDHPYIKKLQYCVNKQLNASLPPIGLTYGTDAAILVPETQVPFVIFGPGDPAMAHQVNEKVLLSEVVQTAKILVAFILETFII